MELLFFILLFVFSSCAKAIHALTETSENGDMQKKILNNSSESHREAISAHNGNGDSGERALGHEPRDQTLVFTVPSLYDPSPRASAYPHTK